MRRGGVRIRPPSNGWDPGLPLPTPPAGVLVEPGSDQGAVRGSGGLEIGLWPTHGSLRRNSYTFGATSGNDLQRDRSASKS